MTDGGNQDLNDSRISIQNILYKFLVRFGNFTYIYIALSVIASIFFAFLILNLHGPISDTELAVSDHEEVNTYPSISPFFYYTFSNIYLIYFPFFANFIAILFSKSVSRNTYLLSFILFFCAPMFHLEGPAPNFISIIVLAFAAPHLGIFGLAIFLISIFHNYLISLSASYYLLRYTDDPAKIAIYSAFYFLIYMAFSFTFGRIIIDQIL